MRHGRGEPATGCARRRSDQRARIDRADRAGAVDRLGQADLRRAFGFSTAGCRHAGHDLGHGAAGLVRTRASVMRRNRLRRCLPMIATGLLCLFAACASTPVHGAYPPIVFVHGNGDNAAIWMSTIWRYESNGWPRERLYALDLPNPMARDDDATAQEGRSSTEDYRRFIAAEVERVLAATGAKQVVLIGSSRGANAIRNYIENDAGRRTVSHAIIAGGTSHGVWADAAVRPRNEFNGAGPFLTGLNAPKGPTGDEVTAGPKWMTLRSDHEDKYTQPYGTWLGMPDMPTHVTFDGPALKGALNVVLPGLDHREVAFHPKAFAKSFEFITGHPPPVFDPIPRSRG